jgi:GNAT superfamily N-acetyltransferase
VLVRKATPGDALAVGRVRNRSWQAAYAHLFPAEALSSLDDESALAWSRRILAAPSVQLLVGELDGMVVGFSSFGAAWDEADAGAGELYAIYVDPDAWGAGVGQALMAGTLTWFRERGFAEAILWVFEDNPRTRRFYELSGWTADGGIKDEEWFDIVRPAVRYRIALDRAV